MLSGKEEMAGRRFKSLSKTMPLSNSLPVSRLLELRVMQEVCQSYEI